MKRDFPCGPVAKTHAPDAGGSSLVPGQETRFHTQELKIPSATIPGGSAGKESACNAGDLGLSLGKESPWRRKGNHSVFLPGKRHARRSLVDYSPQGHKSWTRLSD